MNPIDILKADDVNLHLTLEGITLATKDETVLINYEALRPLELFLLRLSFGSPKPILQPGTDTSQILRNLMIAQQEDQKPQ